MHDVIMMLFTELRSYTDVWMRVMGSNREGKVEAASN